MYARVVAIYIRSACISRGTVRERLIASLWFQKPFSPAPSSPRFFSLVGPEEGPRASRYASTRSFHANHEPLGSRTRPPTIFAVRYYPYPARNTPGVLISTHVGNESASPCRVSRFFTITFAMCARLLHPLGEEDSHCPVVPFSSLRTSSLADLSTYLYLLACLCLRSFAALPTLPFRPFRVAILNHS